VATIAKVSQGCQNIENLMWQRLPKSPKVAKDVENLTWQRWWQRV